MIKIKPKELKTMRYWIHLVILAIVVLYILQLFTGGNMLTFKNILWSIPLLAIGDIIAHTLTGID